MSDEVLMDGIEMPANIVDLADMYYCALTVIAEDNEIEVEQAHMGIQLMITNIEDAIVPTEISKELH